jgi:hypothetical protein
MNESKRSGILLDPREVGMARIKAVIPPELIAQLREAADASDSFEETVQGAIQMTFPTAEVRYSEEASEVTVAIPDDEMISALLGIALYDMGGLQQAAAAVKPDTIEAKDAQARTSSDVSTLVPWPSAPPRES